MAEWDRVPRREENIVEEKKNKRKVKEGHKNKFCSFTVLLLRGCPR